ncbi:hypothetical protein [Labrenzia sp. 011]|uniref:hypothetical protein n=1 Tax=Labrenzia sp. 011 TaxID=2171494 RepID=UPI000D50856C|nr:hypothetical protein [Labrenzia sp. 011]PVB61991.1 hypothetical protein DCO57_08850 [Labrenzia sp. 011]
MAHSLFEPAPTPLGEKLWRRMKDFRSGFSAHSGQNRASDRTTASNPLRQAEHLDARGRQQLLEEVMIARPIPARQGPRVARTHGPIRSGK